MLFVFLLVRPVLFDLYGARLRGSLYGTRWRGRYKSRALPTNFILNTAHPPPYLDFYYLRFSPQVCGWEYLRDFDVGGISFSKTGRVCHRAGCGGCLRNNLLDWEDSLPEQEFQVAEHICQFLMYRFGCNVVFLTHVFQLSVPGSRGCTASERPLHLYGHFVAHPPSVRAAAANSQKWRKTNSFKSAKDAKR